MPYAAGCWAGNTARLPDVRARMSVAALFHLGYSVLCTSMPTVRATTRLQCDVRFEISDRIITNNCRCFPEL